MDVDMEDCELMYGPSTYYLEDIHTPIHMACTYSSNYIRRRRMRTSMREGYSTHRKKIHAKHMYICGEITINH